MIFQVIPVSNAPTGQTNILQRSLNMPLMRGTSTVSASGSSIPHVIQRSGSVEGLPPHIIQQRATPGSMVVRHQLPQAMPSVTNGNLRNIITVATSHGQMASSSIVSGSPYVTSSLSAIKPRTKTITAARHKAPQVSKKKCLLCDLD